MLTVGARLAPEDLAGGGGDGGAVGLDGLAVRLHRQLLQVRGEAGEIIRIRQHRTGFRAEEVAVPEADEAEQNWCVLGERCRPEVLVDPMKTVEEFGECLFADNGHDRQPDCRVHGITSAHPVPKAEHVVGVDAEVRDAFGVGGHGDEMLGDGVLTECVDEPAPGRGGVRECLEGGERLGRDDEQRRRRVESVERADEIGGVDVGYELRGDPRVGVVPECVVDHDRAQIGSTDADVDDGGDLLAGGTDPFARTHAIGEFAHGREDFVHIGDDVLAVDGQRRIGGKAQRGVQNSAILGGVDVFACEHGVALAFDVCGSGQFDQQGESLAGDAVLAVVDVKIRGGEGEGAPSVGVIGEQSSEMSIGNLGVVIGQFLPGIRAGDIDAHTNQQ